MIDLTVNTAKWIRVWGWFCT